MNETNNTTEFEFNDDLAIRIEKQEIETNIQRIYRRTYTDLPNDINQLEPDFIISLHCNAYNKTVSGTEVLYYYKSTTGKIIAQILQNNLIEELGLKDLGIKPKTAEDRGGLLLKYTKAPCLIANHFLSTTIKISLL